MSYAIPKGKLRKLGTLALTAMLGGCYSTEHMYPDVGAPMRFDEDSYLCGSTGKDNAPKAVTVTERNDGKGGVWYEPHPNLFYGKDQERFAFHPIGGHMYVIVQAGDETRQAVMIARVKGSTLEVINPIPAKAAELAKKHHVIVDDKQLTLEGKPDDRHAFLLDIAKATDGTQVIYRCQANN